MCFSKISRSAPGGASTAAAGQAGHDLAQGRGAVLGLGLTFGPLDAQALEVVAQARQRALVKKAGQVVGGVGQYLAATHPDEQVEVLPPHALHIAPGRRLAKRGVRQAEGARVTAQPRQPAQELRIGGARQQRGEEGVLLRPRGIDLVEGLRLGAEQVRRSTLRATPVAASTASTRSAGMRPSWRPRAGRCQCAAQAR